MEEHNELINKHAITRYNTIDYLKEIGGKFAPLPEHIIKTIIKNTKPNFAVYIAVYTILFFYQDEYNASTLPTKEKQKQFFSLTDKTAKKVLDKLEELGVIAQIKQQRKKIILVKYPEYVDNVKSIKYTEKITKTVTTTVEKTMEVNYDKKQNEVESFLNEYIAWKNSKEQVIKNPTGFKKAYYKNPADFDFSDYKEYQKKKEQKKLMEQRRQKQIKKDIEKRKEEEKQKEERKKIYEKIKQIKENNNELYSKLYKYAEKQAIADDPDSKNMDKHMFAVRVRNVYLPEIIKDEGLL